MALGEFDLIARYFARATPQAVLGPGDDCALVQPAAGMDLALTTDLLVEGTHFLPGTDPHDLGWKTLAVNLSDLAAMGARPRWALLALCLPAAEEAWLAAFAGGFHACAREFGVDLIGGDTTRGPLNLCVTAIGEVPAGQALRRSGAKAGDDIWISGQPGLAALGLTHLQGGLELPPRWQARCIERLQAPGPGSGWARPCAPWPTPPSTSPTACSPTWATSPGPRSCKLRSSSISCPSCPKAWTGLPPWMPCSPAVMTTNSALPPPPASAWPWAASPPTWTFPCGASAGW